MKTIALATALTAALAAPAAFASDNLAASLGVEPGVYSTSELVRLSQALSDNDHAEVAFILNGGAGPVDGSIAFDARIRNAAEDDEHALVAYLNNSGTEVISTQSFGHNDVAARIFAELAEETRFED
ncbi:hypothetical protein [Nioella aestuarii]|uniref:hypothetical protein n=1 Tax=Nioella aestuarii TaxID=1662864 RepID=UPI003D7F99FF